MPLPTPLRRLAAMAARTAERAAGPADHPGPVTSAAPADGGNTAAPARAPGEPTVEGDGDRAARDRAATDRTEGTGVTDGVTDGAEVTVDSSGPAAAEETGPPETADSRADPMEAAVERAQAAAEDTGGLGRPGKPMDRRSPFFIGMTAAAGVAVTYAAAVLLLRARSVLILIGVALFIAAGLDRAVVLLTRRGVPRLVAVLVILLAAFGLVAGFVAAAIPPLAAQATALANHLPGYLHALQNQHSELGKLNLHYHIEQRLKTLISSRGTTLIGGILGAGQVVLSAAESVFVVAVLVIYFLATMPQIRRFIYRLVPNSRRPRAILIGNEIFDKVGGFILGNLLTSLIAGIGTYIWLVAFGVPYPILLALFVALLDLIPVIGSTIGGAIVTLVSLTVSLTVAILTLAFYIAYRLAEDYLIVPKVMGRTVQVPAVVSLVAVLVGGTLLGIIGALVAIPAAAALRLLLNEVTFRRLDSS